MTTHRSRPCPRWREALLTLLALYPAVLVADELLGPHVHDLPRPIAVLASVAPVVAAMTYVLMPAVFRLASAVGRRNC